MGKKLHKSIFRDKKTKEREQHHRKIEKEYEELRREIDELKYKQGKDRHYHTKRLHKKAKTLHQKSIKHDHPHLKESLRTMVTGLGQLVSKGVQWIGNKASELSDKIKTDRQKSTEQEQIKKEVGQKLDTYDDKSEEDMPEFK